MADIDNMRGDTLRVVEENTLDNMRGVTQRVISENSIDNTRGVTYRVYNVNPTPAPVIDELNVTPSTSAQTITAPEGVDGYSPVNVSAVDNTIDANIVAGNIKKDVQILGVTGSYEGQIPTGTMYIISNGTYNVADKAIANVNVPGLPEIYRVYRIDNGKITNSNTTPFMPLPSAAKDVDTSVFQYAYKDTPANIISGNIDLSGLTMVSGSNAFSSAFYNCPGITSADFSGITIIKNTAGNAFANTFQGCSALTSVNFSGLTTIESSGLYFMCNGCANLTSVNLSSLTTIAMNGSNALGFTFQNCTKLESLDLSSLTTLKASFALYGMCQGCIKLTSVDLSSLSEVSGASALTLAFAGCTRLTSLSFPALTTNSFGTSTNQFNNMIQNVTGCTLHFPSNLSSKISSMTGYPNFGGTSTTVLFDLPATS